MTDITDRIAALGPKPDPDSWGYFAKLYARERRERDLALEVLRAVSKLSLGRKGYSSEYLGQLQENARAVLAACGKGEG